MTGQLPGMNTQAIVLDLESRSLIPLEVREYTHVARPVKVSVRTMALFYRQLGELLRSGVPILRALQLLSKSKSRPKLGSVISQIADDVSKGEGLAESMEKYSATFADIHIAMVRAGERGGFLEDVLERLSTFLQKQADIRATVLGAMIYPAFVLTLGLVIVVGVMTFFVPKFRPMLTGIALPLPTRIVFAVSDLISGEPYVTILALAGLVGGSIWLLREKRVRAWIGRTSLRVPVIGPLVGSMSVARFCRILGTLLGNGIPMLHAMDISKDAAGNPVMIEAIVKATKAVSAGETLADPLEQSGLFDADVVEIIRIGESANNLDTVLVSLAETIEGRVDRLISGSVRLVEPILLVALGVTLLFIILSLVIPMVLLSASVG